MARRFGVTILVALLAGLVACSEVMDRGSQGIREDARQETVYRERATTQERTAADPAAPEKRRPPKRKPMQ